MVSSNHFFDKDLDESSNWNKHYKMDGFRVPGRNYNLRKPPNIPLEHNPDPQPQPAVYESEFRPFPVGILFGTFWVCSKGRFFGILLWYNLGWNPSMWNGYPFIEDMYRFGGT